MAEGSISFGALPDDFQQVIKMAEAQQDISLTPLQELGGGRSGALLFLVRVIGGDSENPEHLILKLDRVHPKASADEIARHKTVQQKSPSGFAEDRIPKLAFDRVEHNGALAIFYTIAGQSLRRFRTLSSFRRQNQLKSLFTKTNSILLDEWNPDLRFETLDHPRQLMEDWLGFRLESGQSIESFIQQVCQLPADSSGFLVRGNLMPNPLRYAREAEEWGSVRTLDAAYGYLHRDLNTNNILAKFSRRSDELDAYYLIDFALFKEDKPLFYDQRYLEMSYLLDSLSSKSLESVVALINRYSEVDMLTDEESPVEMTGVNAVIRAGRHAFEKWVEQNHESLQDDLWGQYWLAGSAAGLGYCHKDGMADEMRLAGLIYAAANLKQFLSLFDLSLPSEAGQLYAEGQFSRAKGTPVPEAEGAQHNLPASRTQFIGRESELEEVAELLHQPDSRLVSLTGPGGTGKTRLALEAARHVLDEFPQGVYFIGLAELRDPDLVIPTAAHTLGIREGGTTPALEKLKNFLARRVMLLIFDNFEHVVEAAQSISELLEISADLTVLVTSRVPLQLHGETEYPVSPLEVPPEKGQDDKDIRDYEAVVLFQQHAQAVQPNFEITSENQQAVAEICRRLDGLPLAIEIAAARIKMLPPQAMLERLDDRLEFLVSPAKDLPDRQQTLREAIEWSFELLDRAEQDLFIRMGVFAGGFTLDAADEICPMMNEMEVFDGVETLLNYSLVRQVTSVTDEPRFDMLQSIREYAQTKAEEQHILDELNQAHCTYFTKLASLDMESGIYGGDSALWLKIFEEEHDNLRQAMKWALDHPEENVESLLSMITQLSWFWYRYGYLQEGSEWMERALEATEELGESAPRAFALSGRGSLALWSGDLKLAAERTRQAMEMAQRLGLDQVIAFSKMTHGTVLVNQGRDKEAYPHLVDSIEMYEDLGLQWMKGTSMVHLANISLGLDDPEQAREWLDKARPFMNKSGDVWFKAFVLSNYGEVARAQGNYEKAEDYYRRTEDLYQEADAKSDQARLITVRAYLAQHKDEFEKAQTLFMESLAEFRKLGNQRGIAEALAGLAGLAAEQGEEPWATRLLAAAEALLEKAGGEWWPADRVEIERAKERCLSDLGDDYSARWEDGESMSIDEAITYAEAGW